ncbi:hypothetical protein ACM43_00935 [Bradyrhizobium sp. CCBAU 45321]|nr:hypothetical protein [Bradyrhizobium sp. CCBAU 45321]
MAVVGDNEPLVRTVLCRTVANTLSMGLVTGMRWLGANVPLRCSYIVAYGATIGTEAPGARSADRPMHTMSRELELGLGLN